MLKNIIKEYPEYMNEFECIGGTCTDSCCIGWDIDIDKVTFRQYYKVKDDEMKRMFQRHLRNNQNCTSENIDYGKVTLGKNKRCPFLNDENYCHIYSRLGEEYLSNVCTCFPRVTNKVDGIYEMSLDVACPEAARLILGNEKRIEFKSQKVDLGKHIVSTEVDTSVKHFKGTPFKYFKELRSKSIEIIQDRRFNIRERLFALGVLLDTLENKCYENANLIPKIIKEFNISNVIKEYEENEFNYLLQVDFFKKMVQFLNVFKEVDSIVFKEHTKDMIKGFKLDGEINLGKDSEYYINAFREYNDKYLEKHNYIFENYLVNFIYNNMFPFSQNDSMFDGYLMLLERFSFIRFYLVGKYIVNKDDCRDNIISFIQVFSKTIEHHKTYLKNSLTYIKQKEFDNIEFAKTLL